MPFPFCGLPPSRTRVFSHHQHTQNDRTRSTPCSRRSPTWSSPHRSSSSSSSPPPPPRCCRSSGPRWVVVRLLVDRSQKPPQHGVTDNSMPSHHLNTHLYIHTRNSSTAATAGTGSCASAACSSQRPSRSRRRTSASTRSCSTTGRAPVRACARAVRRESGFVFTIYLCALPMMSHTNLHRITQYHRRRRLGRGGG